MKNVSNTSRSIAIISVLAGIAYLYLISVDFINNWDSSVNSFMQGYNESSMRRVNETPKDLFSLHLSAKDLQHYYTDSLMNLKTNTFLPVKYQNVEVSYQFNDTYDRGMQLKYRVIFFIIVFVLFILLIAVPVYFFRIIGAFYKNDIFSYINVKILNILGVLLVIIFALGITLDIVSFNYQKSLIEIPNYSLSIYLSGAEWLFMGLISLLIASILKRSVEMKEEQDLTI
jgi:hypothetical protein